MSKSTKTLFSIADEPPSWSDMDSDDMGLESVSEPDMESVHDDPDGDDFYDTHTGESRSAVGDSERGRDSAREKDTPPPGELSTTDESMEAVTPGPRHNTRFDTMRPGKDKRAEIAREATNMSEDDLDGDDDDWVDPTPPPPADLRELPGVENGAPASISVTPSPDLVPSPSVPSVVSEGSSLIDSPVGTHSRRKSRRDKEEKSEDKYPFPAGDEPEPEELVRSKSTRQPQMRNVRARDGGRTKSGGVRGLVDKESRDEI